MGQAGVSHLAPFRNSFIFSRRQSRQTASVYRAMPYTRLLFRGRHPLWGVGVTSLIEPTSMPAACNERIAVSRPEPGPFTSTSTLRTPCSWARRAACSAASCAAKGVDLREPLKPTLPADAHDRALPSMSVMVMIVLLKDDLMCATP